MNLLRVYQVPIVRYRAVDMRLSLGPFNVTLFQVELVSRWSSRRALVDFQLWNYGTGAEANGDHYA